MSLTLLVSLLCAVLLGGVVLGSTDAGGSHHIHARNAKGGPVPPATTRDYVLITLLRTMHERGTDAEKALAPLVARVDAVKPADTAERAAAMVALYNAAASNAAFADFKEAAETIESYDFDEE